MRVIIVVCLSVIVECVPRLGLLWVLCLSLLLFFVLFCGCGLLEVLYGNMRCRLLIAPAKVGLGLGLGLGLVNLMKIEGENYVTQRDVIRELSG